MVTKTLTIKREDLDLFTLHDLVKSIKKIGIELTPEQEFRITAMIKRHVHYEKRDLMDRITFYGDRDSEFGMSVVKEKAEAHRKYAKLPDEELVTWDVGTHKYKK